ncbi:MAG: 16S rRNA (cytosine(1402)-N(4))-methyltransferase RsmH [Ignavibacterium sp.]|jgi:16S rRNA (cytosine1402-N4)-methyltransferase|nr:16S rRNA (cytosine(1402)-N(4))-methyltransferase RsmH [Ignavibacterium sp.]
MIEHHIPVMLFESLDLLITDQSGVYFDATLGFGGHTTEILKRLTNYGRIVAADVDTDAFEYSQKKFSKEDRVSIYNFNFSFIDVITKIESLKYFDGVIADLGVSSFQLDNPESGFTFRADAPLDLRMDKTKEITAADIINSYSEEDLADILFKYGEEKNSRKIARSIVQKRLLKKIETTRDITEIISELVPEIYLRKSLARIFQALRIYVNDELGNLKLFLENSVNVLKKGGRIVVISYHSLEDRIVKDFFKGETVVNLSPKEDPLGLVKREARLKLINKKPIVPSENEIKNNYRARSAKLRAAERL